LDKSDVQTLNFLTLAPGSSCFPKPLNPIIVADQ
jgi:hypothetical protein